MNIWHDISDERINPEEFVAVIEIPKGSKKKYEIDKETGLLELDRITPSGMFYPHNYGFIPRTLCEDGDALDVWVITSETLDPLTLVKCRPVAAIEMIDNGERDEKIIAVPVKDPNDDLPKNTVTEIIHFLKYYKAQDPKNNIDVYPAGDQTQAIKYIKEAKTLYNEKFGGKK